jgi:hypothetical protein
MRIFIISILLLLIFSCYRNNNVGLKVVEITVGSGFECNCTYRISEGKEEIEVDYIKINTKEKSYKIPIDSNDRDTIINYVHDILNLCDNKEYEGSWLDGFFLQIECKDKHDMKHSVLFRQFSGYDELGRVNSNIPKLLSKLKKFDKEKECW